MRSIDPPSTSGPGRGYPLLILGIVLVGLNLRAAIAGVGPLVPEMRADSGLSNTALGLLTTLPLLAFGVVSLVTAPLTRRLGIERAMLLGLTLLGVGTAMRAAPSIAALYLGTILLGIGIAVGNVLLPTLAKRDFPDHNGPITSLYSSMMGIGATLAAGVSVPIARALGWRGSLGIWALPALVALVVWLPQLFRSRRPARGAPRGPTTLRVLGSSRLAWQVALYMGLQSLTFYVIIAWLPDLLQSRGMDEAGAGWMLALAQATGIAGTAVIPLWAGRTRDQRPIIWTLALVEGVSLGGLIVPQVGMTALWVGLLGFILGGTFGLALTLLELRSADAEAAGALSGMAQSVGYLVAAMGPTLFGLLHDLTAEWTAPLLLLVAALVGKVACGLPAGRDEVIGAPAYPDAPTDFVVPPR